MSAVALASAQRALAEGEIGQAEALARQILEIDPDNARAYGILGTVAGMVDLPRFAIPLLERAQTLDPAWDMPRRNLTLLRERLAARPDRIAAPLPIGSAPPGHILIKAWGHGFWADVDHVVGGLLISEITGREPWVLWGHNCRYNRGRTANAFADFFEPIGTAPLATLPHGPDATWPPKWRGHSLTDENVDKWRGPYSRTSGLGLLARTEKLVIADFYVQLALLRHWIPAEHALAGLPPVELYRRLLARWIKPRADLREQALAFVRSRLGENTIAVHARGTDKVLETGDLHGILPAYFALLDARDPRARVFLMTDDQSMAAIFLERYGDAVILPDALRASGLLASYMDDREDGLRLGREVLRDVLIALGCDQFIGNGASMVSCYVALLRNWPSQKCALLGPNCLFQPNDLIFDRARKLDQYVAQQADGTAGVKD